MAGKSKKKKTNNKKTNEPNENYLTNEEKRGWVPFLWILLAVFVFLCLVIPNELGVVGLSVHNVLRGLFSYGGYVFPLVIVAYIIFLKNKYRAILKGICLWVIFLSLCTLIACASPFTKDVSGSFFEIIKKLYLGGVDLNGGGVIGGLIGYLYIISINTIGGIIVSVLLIIASILIISNQTPYALTNKIKEGIEERKRQEEEYKKSYQEVDNTKKYSFKISQKEEGKQSKGTFRDQFRGIPYEVEKNSKLSKIDAFSDEEDSIDDIPYENVQETPIEKVSPNKSGKVDLEKIFREGEILEKEEKPAPIKKEVKEVKEPKPEKKKVGYVLPPSYLLREPEKVNKSIGETEAKENAIKLVRTLSSFRVETKIADISRGPTITRYELVPEEGVRVRSVANLVDDIALSLATEGVRIEAPIPGKAAIGIEVPNKQVETVYLRELIENPEFKNAKSILNVCLGMDVAGTPRYFDIAKMPHLLIAGATGMGKSVCINSIICSLLYRATPEEVKLILIDPKKVEFNMYNGLPHLLVPVVSQPKKAAGTLSWACLEMERRFELIEDVGVRDINGYNEAIKNDPDREFLPKIVIIIDELADLMMTAPDDVENSICRLAQKARAAGMHLIIGTQRPSVDVITGVIKANIPSRIACTVASQIDSRTIIDIAGAEKLIGRGDMLFAPVGLTKPIRVQGSFVSDGEVEKIVDFIKEQMDEVSYDESVVEKIDEEAKRCGQGKRGAARENAEVAPGDEDPRIMEALEVAVESGKISTSLLQRKMSIGYGKAAKLIDQMEAKGWVGPLDGSKPRDVRVSREAFYEMKTNKDNTQEE